MFEVGVEVAHVDERRVGPGRAAAAPQHDEARTNPEFDPGVTGIALLVGDVGRGLELEYLSGVWFLAGIAVFVGVIGTELSLRMHARADS